LVSPAFVALHLNQIPAQLPILAGIELMHMIRKSQFMRKGEGMSFADQFYAFAGQLHLA
jgi:hypothetical protein